MDKALHPYYRAKAELLFKPNMVNNPDDEEAFVEVCLRLMEQNGVVISDDEDDWLEFVYRAQEICELHEKGFYYHKIRREDGSFDHALETIEMFRLKMEEEHAN